MVFSFFRPQFRQLEKHQLTKCQLHEYEFWIVIFRVFATIHSYRRVIYWFAVELVIGIIENTVSTSYQLNISNSYNSLLRFINLIFNLCGIFKQIIRK